jgi:soluble lytic murein transglycosylase-like protein
VRYGDLVDNAARFYHVSAHLLYAVILAESAYRSVADRFDPRANIAAGAQHLGWLLARLETRA